MKLAFVANSEWYISNFRINTIRHFKKKYDVYAVCPSSGKELLTALPVSPFYLDATSTNPVKEIRSLISLYFRIKKIKPGLVFSFNPKTNLYSLIVCKITNTPCVPNVSGVGVASAMGGLTGWIYRVFCRYFYSTAVHVFFQNPDDQKAFIDEGWVSPSRSSILPGSGVDIEAFLPTIRGAGESFKFLMASRMIRPKGVQEYIDSCRALSKDDLDCEYLLAGSTDSTRRSLSPEELSLLNDDGVIQYLGHVDNMPSLLASCDCVVLPSYYPEGTPRILLEAISCGKIIITTDMPGCREVVIDGENGYLVPPEDVVSLISAMRKVFFLDEKEKSSMRVKSREMAEAKFDEKKVINEYDRLAQKFT